MNPWGYLERYDAHNVLTPLAPHSCSSNVQGGGMWSAAARRTVLLRRQRPGALDGVPAAVATVAAAARGGGGGSGVLQAGGARRHQSTGVYNFPPSAHYDLVSLWTGGRDGRFLCLWIEWNPPLSSLIRRTQPAHLNPLCLFRL